MLKYLPMEMYETYAIIAITCISLLITVLYNINKKNTYNFRGKNELKFLIYALITVFVFKELQYIFTFLFKKSVIEIVFVESLFIALYYVVYFLPIIAVTLYFFACINRKINTIQYFLLFLPLIIMVILSITSLFTPCLYSVAPNGDLIYGPAYLYLPIVSLCYMIFDIILTVKYKERLEKGCFETFIPIFIAPFLALLFSYFLIFGLGKQNMSLIWIALVVALTIHYFNFIEEILSTTDSLTMLPNKQRLVNYLEKLLRSKKREDVYGIMLDLDNFKNINDNYGHTIGDVALKDAANILLRSASKNSFTARFAGDEFVVLISSKNNEEINDFIKNLEFQMNKFNKENTKQLYEINFSYGYFLFKKDENYDITTFLKIIDQNMYEDKRNKKESIEKQN